jgi:membrane-associated phospholipid phosphatase
MIRLARWVSIVAHPFVTTLVLAAAIEAPRGGAAAARTVGAVAALFVLPVALLMARQVRRGAWGTVDASDPRERPVLFLVGGTGLLALLVYFARAHPGSALVSGTAGVLAMVAVCAAVTPWLKLSLHMAAAALAATVLLERGLALGWLLGAALPVLGWSRVALGRHRWREVAAGLVVGACTGALVVRLG